MIKEWQISNFKSISKETSLKFSPLTIFAGANSSGKSTIIQSILLIAQTLSNKVVSRPVVLNGYLSTLGQFNDIKSKSIENNHNEISIKCTYESSFQNKAMHQNHYPSRVYESVNQYQTNRYSSNDIMNINFDVCFDADPLNQKAELFQIQPRLKSTNLSCSSNNISTKNANIKINHTNHSIANLEDSNEISDFDDQFRSSLSYSIMLDENSLLDLAEGFKSVKLIGCFLNHFLPDYIIYTVENAEINAKVISNYLQNLYFGQDTKSLLRVFHSNIPKEITVFLKNLLKDELKLDLDLDLNSNITTLEELFKSFNQLEEIKQFEMKRFWERQDHLFENIYSMMKILNAGTNDVTIFKRAIPDPLKKASKQIDDFFSFSLKYLGPLRDTPKQLYPLTPNIDPNNVGIRGENTALILELNKNKKIQYIPSSYFANHKSTENFEKVVTVQTLELAVIDWLQYLGLAQSVQTKDKGKLGYELKILTDHSTLGDDLTHVGVGVSQVLPILVMCLLSDVGTTLIFEQPELHLHPKVQTLLADFFLSITFCNKQCIIESHSEYLVDRLRFRMASTSNAQNLNDAVTIYFVEKEGQNSKFSEVEINEYGAILEWPEGFFDQSQKQAEEILNAAMQKRILNRKSK